MLFETFAIKDGKVLNINYHQIRYSNSLNYLKSLGIPIDENLINLKDIVCDIPLSDVLVRCRLDYNGLDIKINFFDYTPKSIHSFKIIECDDIDYSYKYDDRSLLNDLLSQKATCDEIIIIKNGFVTDCSIGNLLFLKNETWYTPDAPLLKGTQRAYLLDNQKIKLTSIKKEDIVNYEKVMMINALNPFDKNRAIAVKNIY